MQNLKKEKKGRHHKAALKAEHGPNLLPARILKELAEELSPYLTVNFQRSFDAGIVPKAWRTANVTAIFKI